MNETVLDEVALYIRTDANDNTLKPIVMSAIAYIESATGKEFDRFDEVHMMLLKMLSAHWYDNRGTMTPYTVQIPFSVETMLAHIKLASKE